MNLSKMVLVEAESYRKMLVRIKELEEKLSSCKFTIQEQEEEIKALNRIINYGEEEEETPKEPIQEPEEWLPDFMVEEGKGKEYFAEAVKTLKEALENGKNTI